MSNIDRGVCHKYSKNNKNVKEKTSMGRCSWGVTSIQVEINYLVLDFDRKFAR